MVQLSSETNLLISKLGHGAELQKTQLQLVETKERITALNSDQQAGTGSCSVNHIS